MVEAADVSTINILIVDDEPANLVVLETILTDPSYRLVQAGSADQALLALMRDEFALLILDVRMPSMDGFELAQMIKDRKKTASVPIIFLTAYYDEDQHALEGYGSGAVDFLSKPVNASVLRSKVAVFADLHRKTRAVRLANEALSAEVEQRRRAQERLLQLNQTLEQRVDERTEDLRRADVQLREMMTSITDALLMLDLSWHITYANDRAAALLGTDLDRLDRVYLWDLPLEGLGPRFRECAETAVAGSRTTSFKQYFAETGKWLQCHCYPSASGLSVYFLDITDRMEVEERREHLLAAEQAARSEGDRMAQAKDEFLASLSHELRTPLAAIIGWATVLQRPNADPATLKRGIEVIARNAKAQVQLVADLLDVSRAATGKLKMEFHPSDMNAIAAVAADTARPAAQAKGVRMQTRLDASGPALVMGNEERLHQAVSNLISNALKFTPAGGAILVETVLDSGFVELRVADTGEGISPDFLPHLFERFSQADGSTARHHGGLGLGLAIVKNLVELHDGTVHAASEGTGRGSTFTFRLPAAPANATRADEATRSIHATADTVSGVIGGRSGADLGGISILLVDDNPDVLEVHRRILSEAGAAVQIAVSADEALDSIRSRELDVLLSDLGMPGTDGYSLIRTIRHELGLSKVRLPAAAVTAFVRAEDRERALAHGYQLVLQKPVSMQDLLKAVRDLTGLDAPTEADEARRNGAAATPIDVATDTLGKTLRGLYVEDNLDLQEQIGWMLNEAGVDVVACGSAEAALDKLDANSFDVIVADIGLPGMSGVDLAKIVLERHPQSWFVFSTGYAMEDGLRKLGENVRVLVKPFEMEQLQELVDEIRTNLGGDRPS